MAGTSRYDDRYHGGGSGSQSSRRKHHDDIGSPHRGDYRERDRSPTHRRRSRSPPHRNFHDPRDRYSPSYRRSDHREREHDEREARDDSREWDRRSSHRSDRHQADNYRHEERGVRRDSERSHYVDDTERRPRKAQRSSHLSGFSGRTESPEAHLRHAGTTSSSQANGKGPSFKSAAMTSLPERPAFLPQPPAVPLSANASPATPNLDSPSISMSLAPEDEKARARKQRLEAWKKEREAKKALEEAKLRAQNVAAAHAPPTSASLPATSTTKPTSISVAGLKGFGPRQDSNKTKSASSAALDDASEQPQKKQAKKFALPPIDPLIKPGAGGRVGSGSDLEGGDDDDDDDDHTQPAASSSSIAPMQIDRATAEIDDEEDPLDAFMNTIKGEVKSVNAADEKRLGKKAPKVVAPVIGEDEASGDEKATKAEPDELDQAGMRAEDIMALAAKKVKKKDIPTVDHTKIEYESFRKAFYHPPSEVQELSEEDAERLRMELDAIKVRGKDCPKPLTKWSYCGLPASCLDVIKKLDYTSPTPIQSQAIPAIMSGRDIIGVAKTGSGKTMAFLLPMFRHIKDQRPIEKNEGPVGLIMTPTRELAVQIFRESRPFLKATGLRAVCAYGGAPISEQIAEMKKTADIVVATPGRMIDLLTANQGRVTNLLRVTYLVLDEADRMFDMGFEPQVMKIINNIRPDRQTVLFSATFPRQMESLARKVLRNKPLEITVGGRSVVAPEIEQIIEVREEETKFNRLLEILGQTFNLDRETRALVFVDRQKAADELFKQLISKGYTAMSLHGGQDQVDRDATISDFKGGEVDVVIATSIAARGLDVKQLKLVVNYDAPNHMEDYVHRAGRTGRAGNKGTCVTFITPEQDRYARDIIAALKASKVAVPADLQKLADDFAEKVKAGKAQAASSGFGGKGLERLESDREKNLKAQRSAYGEGDDTETSAAGTQKDQQGQKDLDEIKVQRGPAPADDQLGGVHNLHIEVKKGAAPESIRENKVRAEGDEVKKPVANDQATAAAEVSATTDAAKEKAMAAAQASGANPAQLAQALAKINSLHQARLAARQAEVAEREAASKGDSARKPKDPDATDYHAIVPINDFPQKARWRCTNKETMSKLITETGASVTLKGVFYEKGVEPEPGQPPKLQLLIESNDEDKVEGAVRALKQILLEATQAVLEAEQRGPPGETRYNVV